MLNRFLDGLTDLYNVTAGIPPEVQDHLFTPFYSSKKDGRGIGLTVVREVLLRHGFDFKLDNREPGCAEFSIYF